jgi:hypothetical protein
MSRGWYLLGAALFSLIMWIVIIRACMTLIHWISP